MKIFIIARGVPAKGNPLLGIFEMDQAKALHELGHEVVLLSVDLRSIRRKRTFGFNHYDIEGIPVEEVSIPLGNIPRAVFMSLGEKAFRQLYKRTVKKYGKPDIVHSHFADISCITSRGLNDPEVKHVITEHSSQLNREMSDFDAAEFKKAYSEASMVISVSSSLQNRIRELSGVDSICIHNIVDLGAFTFSGRKQDREKFSFITVAGLNENKNITSLVQAFKIVSEEHDDVKLTIVGDGPQKGLLEELITDFSLQDKVVMTGTLKRPEINRLFTESECFVLPSKSETFGVVYIEAMAAGLPVLATKCGGPEDFVDDENGILIEENTIESLASAMLEIYAGYDKYDNAEISTVARKRFSAENIAKQIEQVYRTI